LYLLPNGGAVVQGKPIQALVNESFTKALEIDEARPAFSLTTSTWLSVK